MNKVTQTDVLKFLSKKNWHTTAYVAWKLKNRWELDAKERASHMIRVKNKLTNLVRQGLVEVSNLHDCRGGHEASRTIYRKVI